MNRNVKYKRSKNGQVAKMYSNQKTLSVKRGYALPDYTKEQLGAWVFSQSNFEKIYTDWVESDYDRYLAPSCDRLDDYKPYTLDNIRLVTWRENMTKAHADRVSGTNSKKNKAVVQLDLSGNVIKEHVSAMSAERETGNRHSHITNCCKGKHSHIGGFIWEFKEAA